MFKSVDDESPVVHVTTEHEGLTQVSNLNYSFDENGKRHLEGPCKRTIKLRLPLIFTPEVWRRHEYSLEDVIDTLNYFKSNQLWQLALLLGIPLSNSSVKLSFSGPCSLVFSSKAIVMVKIGDLLRKHYSFPETSVLDKTHNDHVPQLPVHKIRADSHQYWKARVPESSYSHLERKNISEFFSWKDIQMVPMALEGDHLYMIRVVAEGVFLNSEREIVLMAPSSRTLRPTARAC
jgi:hypothetical protein